MPKQIFPFFISCLLLLQYGNSNGQYLEWAKQLGGNLSTNFGRSIAVDKSGYVYTAGTFSGTADFDPGGGIYSFTTSPFSAQNFFISKLDEHGNFVWAKHFVSSTGNSVNAIAVDDSSNIYVTGGFSGTVDFDPGPSNYNLTSSIKRALYVCKLDSLGNFLWAKQTGNATVNCIGKSISLDNSGNILVAGTFGDSIDFDLGTASFYLRSIGYDDIFILKITNNGNFLWANQIGGLANNDCQQIVTDIASNVYITGLFSDTVDFDPAISTYDLISHGQNDAYILKLNSSGVFVWARHIGGPLIDAGSAITVDYVGNVYLAGGFRDTVDFDPGPSSYLLYSTGTDNIFVLNMDSAGSFLWAGQISGTGSEACSNIYFDKYENLILGGTFNGQADFDPGMGVYNLNAGGNYHGFICKIHISGNLLWAVQLEGTAMNHNSNVSSLYADSLGKVYATSGFFGTIDFDPGAGAYYMTASQDAYVLKLNITPIGIPELSNNKSEIIVYPNPSKNIVTLWHEQELQKIELYNIVGEKLFELACSKNSKTEMIDISQSSSGLYFLKIYTKNGTSSLKFLKE